jgi:hypothetical protein
MDPVYLVPLEDAPRQRAVFLKWAGDFQTELFRVMAGFVPALSRWELRRSVPDIIFRDARRVQDLRTRCRELTGVAGSLHLSKGIAGQELLASLCAAPSAHAAFRAIFGIVKPKVRSILEGALSDRLRVFDAPSTPMIEANISELERQSAWAKAQPEIQMAAPADWLAQIHTLAEGLCEAAMKGGTTAEPVVRGRKAGNLPVLRSVIPEGFRNSIAKISHLDRSDYPARELFHAHNFLMEIQAADSCASLLFEAPDMPWEFYFDLARHMWDETRHCEFGEMKLRALGCDIREMGLSNTAYVLRQTLDPLDRYAALTTQEADAFPGKSEGLKDALEHRDELLARAWSYDISDETQHVRYGHKWIPAMINLTGEPRSYEELKRDAENWRRDVLASSYQTAADEFARTGKKDLTRTAAT